MAAELSATEEWLESAPFDDPLKGQSQPEFSYEEWFEQGRQIPEVVPELVSTLRRRMSDEPTNLNYGAAYALGWIGDERAFPVLRDAMESRWAIVRRESIAALGRLHAQDALDAIWRHLVNKQEDSDVRANACIALANLKSPQSEARLQEVREDSDEFVAQCAEEGLRLLRAG